MTDEDCSSEEARERTLIRSGRGFEREYRLDASEAGEFLLKLGEQLRDADELTLTADEWELPFAFGEPELEIELTLPGRTDEKAPDVE